jgi:hypothetical protein
MKLQIDDVVKVKEGREHDASHKGVLGTVRNVGHDGIGVVFPGNKSVQVYLEADLDKQPE